MTTKQPPPISFRPGPLAPAIDARVVPGESRNDVAQRDLERYYALLDRTLDSMDWSETEATAIAQALWSGGWSDPRAIASIPYSVIDALESGDIDRSTVDADELVRRIGATTYLQRLAIVDAVERYRAAEGENLLSIGLVKPPQTG